MATTTRSRGGFPDLTMPPPPTTANSDDRTQQQSISNTVFPGSNLYSTNSNIWSTSYANARDRSLGSHGGDDVSSGPSASNANPQTNGWTSRPWNTDTQQRPVSTSPNRTRDAGRSSGSGFFDQASAASMGVQTGNGLGGRPFQDQVSAFGSQRLSPQGTTFLEASVSAFPPSRDASAPPSRQSQNSPAFTERYRGGHTPSSSINSRPFSNSGSFSQTANQRAFNFNRQQQQQQQVEEDLSLGMGRVGLGNGPNSNANPSFNPATQPFQLNPGSQPWAGEASASRVSNEADLNRDMLAQLAAVRRQSLERASPGPSYRLDANNSPRNYAPTPDPWTALPATRDPRTSDAERRLLAQQVPDFVPNLYQTQYPYGNLPPQYAQAYPQAFQQQNFRQPPLPVHSFPMQGGYIPGVNLNGVNIGGVSLPAMTASMDQDPARRTRSRLLDEFRQSSRSSRRFELRDIYNHVVEFSGDQHGSRFIQQKLEAANSDEKDQVFREIEPNAVQLMKDVFGNYVVQKFFDHGNQAQKRVLAEKMKGKVLDLSVQTYACRVVQKALEHVLVEQQVELVQELAVDPFKVIRDSNGNHVVQKMIEVVPREHFEFIMDALRGQVAAMAVHAYGCRVIQRMLERGTEQDKVDIMNELDACVHILITDQYGNYVAQHVIEHGCAENSSRFIEMVLTQVLTYSKHKFASNVVEKCFVKGTAEQRSRVRALLTVDGNDGSSPLLQLARDQYGNYVIQKLLDEFQGDEKAAFEDDIKRGLLATLRQNTLGRQLHALARRVGLDVTGSPGSQQASLARAETSMRNNANGANNSTAPTPVLTDETNTPQSSSPPSTHVSADGVPVGEMDKGEATDGAETGAPRVQDNEA